MESPLEYGLESCIGIWIFQAGQIFLSPDGASKLHPFQRVHDIMLTPGNVTLEYET